MDKKSLCEAADIPVTMLTVWQQRDLVPGYKADVPGRLRDYSVEQAIHVGIMAAVTRLGVGPTTAAAVAREAQQQMPPRRLMLVMPGEGPIFLESEIRPAPPHVSEVQTRTITWKEFRAMTRGAIMMTPFDQFEQLDRYFAKDRLLEVPRPPDAYPYLRPPDAYTIIDVGTIRERMERMEAQGKPDAEPEPGVRSSV